MDIGTAKFETLSIDDDLDMILNGGGGADWLFLHRPHTWPIGKHLDSPFSINMLFYWAP